MTDLLHFAGPTGATLCGERNPRGVSFRIEHVTCLRCRELHNQERIAEEKLQEQKDLKR